MYCAIIQILTNTDYLNSRLSTASKFSLVVGMELKLKQEYWIKFCVHLVNIDIPLQLLQSVLHPFL